MRPEVEQELAHTLLVELLAYQFASPVRWIETQDVILAEQTAERIVEIGPADTLGGMVKRTLASKYEAYDAALSLQRQILCYNKDAKAIYYDIDPVESEPEPASTSATSSTPSQATAAAAAAPAAAAVAPIVPTSGSAPPVPDAPVAAIDILRALVAQKLKKPLLDIPLSKAIKDLVGGESTTFCSVAFCSHDANWTKVNLPSKMRSLGILGRNLAPLQRNRKILHLTNWAHRCKRPSMGSWGSSHPR